MPGVRSGRFADDLSLATVAWAFVATSWFLRRALAEGTAAALPPLHERAPASRAAIQHRLGRVPAGVAPALVTLADEVLEATRRHWGDLRLEFAPAYRPV
jgi:hypothetical protein